MAAGLGFKDFVTGEVLTAADVDGYLMQGVWVFASAAARSAAVTSPQEGNYSYLKDTNSTEYYTGSAWVAVGGSSGANWSLLNSGGTALTAAQTITVSGISGKDKIMVLVSGASSGDTFSFIGLRLNTDTGSNYYQYGTYVEPKDTYGPDMYSTYNGTAAAYFTFSRTGSNAAALISGNALITGCNAAGVKIMQSDGASTGTGRDYIQTSNGGYYNSSSVITSISIISTSGNFDAGTVYVYTSA